MQSILSLSCLLAAALPLADALSMLWKRSSEYQSAIHKGHPAAFVTPLGKKYAPVALDEASPESTRAAHSDLYAQVSPQEFEALQPAQSLVEEKKGSNNSRIAFTALEDVFGSEYVGPIGIGTRTLPAACGQEAVSQLQVNGKKNEDNACEATEVANLKVVFDTGSTNLWMASDLCESPCKESGRHWYNHKDSRTYHPPTEEKYLRITFGTAALAGPMSTDHFHIGPFTLKDQDFGMIEQADGSTFTQMPLEGIVGLAFPAMSATKGGRLPFFDNVIKQGLLEHNEFAFYFSKKADQGGNAIFWGGVDKRAFDGDIRMFPVTQPFYWAVDLYSFKIGDKVMNLAGSLKQRGARDDYSPVPESTMPKLILDTGTTYFTAAGALYDEIKERLPSGPCSETAKYPPIVYTLKDVSGQMHDVVIPSTEYMVSHSGVKCRLAFMELYVNERYGPAMLLGEVFMRTYFTVFDRGNGDASNARVGFGRAKHSEELNSMFGPGRSGILSETSQNRSFLAPKP